MVHVYSTLLIASVDFDDILKAIRSIRTLRDIEVYPVQRKVHLSFIEVSYKGLTLFGSWL